MKKVICIIVLFFAFQNCNTEKGQYEKNFEILYYSYFIINGYYWVNICPPKDATLEPGIHTITLNEGEEYWFNVSENVETAGYTQFYEIGFAEQAGQTLSVGNPGCMRNQQISNPTSPEEIKAEGDEPVDYTDGFAIHRFFLKKDNSHLAGIKSASGSGEIQIKVP